MRKFISSATICTFLTSPIPSVFANFCEEPDVDDKKIIEKVIKNGKYENSATQEEDGYQLHIDTLDFFVNNNQHKKLYTPLIAELIERQAIVQNNKLDARELKEAAFQNLKNAYKGPFRAIRDWWYGEETPIDVPTFTVNDENYFIKQIEELCKGTEISEKDKKDMAKRMWNMQPKFINNKEETVRRAYGEVGTGKKVLYTGGVGAVGATVGTVADATTRYIAKKISKEAAEKVLKEGAEKLIQNSIGKVIGWGTGIGIIVAVGGGIYQLYSEYNYAAQRLLEENYAQKSIDISYTRSNAEIAQEKLKDAIKDGLWIGKNAFYSVVSNNPKCKLTPISMFRKIEGIPDPSKTSLQKLAIDLCDELGCLEILDDCAEYIVKKIDSCVRKDKDAYCPLIPRKGCKELVSKKESKKGEYCTSDCTNY